MKLKYLGPPVRRQYYTHKEIRARLNSGTRATIQFRISSLIASHLKNQTGNIKLCNLPCYFVYVSPK